MFQAFGREPINHAHIARVRALHSNTIEVL